MVETRPTSRIVPPVFDGRALYRALDRRRDAEGLSWPGVARAIWALSSELHEVRAGAGKSDHGIAVSTIKRLDRQGVTTCQHALFFLRWLERTPESFLVDAAVDAGQPLPPCGPDRRPRWDLKRLHAALDEARCDRGELSWAQLARELDCTPSQVTGLKTARFAIRMDIAMRMTGWLAQPAADFIYCANW